MMTFWLIAITLSLMAALFILLPGYLQRYNRFEEDRTSLNVEIFNEREQEYQDQLQREEITQAEYNALVLELKRNLLSETSASDAKTESTAVVSVAGNFAHPGLIPDSAGKLPLVLALVVPVFAFVLYSDVGFSWGSIGDVQLAEQLQGTGPHNKDGMEENLAQLAERLQSQPDNHDGWYLLAQSYLGLKRYEESARAFKHLLDAFPTDHNIWAYYTEALYSADDRRPTERVVSAVAKTLALNPHDVTMLEIQALWAFQAQDYEAAIDGFNKALAAGAQGERAENIERAIAYIRDEFGSGGPANASAVAEAAVAPPVTEATAAPVKEGGVQQRTLQVLVEVAEGVEVAASTPVFVYARAVGGPPMPLAVQRMVRGSLPTLVTLDESMAMMAGMGLANFDQVEVVARISSTGIANASPEDYQALSGPIDLTRNPGVIKLNIEQQVKDF